MEQIARRVTGLDKHQIAEVVYTAAEDPKSYGANCHGWFDVRVFKSAHEAAWFRYWAALACTDFEYGQEERKHFFFSSEFVVIGRVRLYPQSPLSMPEPVPQTERAIQIKERVAGASLASLVDEANRVLDTGNFSSGSATFRSQLSYGEAGAIAWLLNHALSGAGVRARTVALGVMSNKYEVTLVIVEVDRMLFSC